MTEPRRAAEWFERNRRHLATAVAIVACAVLGSELAQKVPRDVALRYDFGPDHAGVRKLEVEILDTDEEVLRTARFAFPEGAPRRQRDSLRLLPGTYVLRARLTGDSAESELIRSFVVPAEGEIRIDLFDQATARTRGLGPDDARRPARGPHPQWRRGAVS